MDKTGVRPCVRLRAYAPASPDDLDCRGVFLESGAQGVRTRARVYMCDSVSRASFLKAASEDLTVRGWGGPRCSSVRACVCACACADVSGECTCMRKGVVPFSVLTQ
jgi:hypothetical protein